jgi:6-phosphogluconolactonase
MKLVEYPTRDALMQGMADVLAQALRDALDDAPPARKTAKLAVPGGSTPGPVFDLLSMVALDWSRVHVLLTDERWVPEDDAASNAALVRARLLQNDAAAALFTPYYQADTDIEAAAADLSRALHHLLPLDLVLLGMGADMHTASLFPRARGLEAAMAADAPMFLPAHVADQPVPRLSMTAPALRTARQTHILITGAEKRRALERAQSLTDLDAPIQTVLAQATVHWCAE